MTPAAAFLVVIAREGRVRVGPRRIARERPDKPAAEADTLDALKALLAASGGQGMGQ